MVDTRRGYWYSSWWMKSIAVIGSGISGLAAASFLSRRHRVDLFEQEQRLGGHTNTVVVDGPNGTVPLDTGFLVHNERNYPLLTRLFRELGVRVQDSEMSFSVACRRCRLEYSGVRLWSQPRALARPGFARLVAEIVRFLRVGSRALDERYARATLGDFVAAEGYSRAFRDHYLVPFASALWSTAPAQTLGFPVHYAVRFFQNHGLLGFRRHPWRTVAGGSRRYVAAVTAPLAGRMRLGAEVRAVARDADGVEVRYLVGDTGVQEVERLRQGSVVEQLALGTPSGARYPNEATYRNLPEFRELKLTRQAVEQVESYPPDIWEVAR